MVFCSLSFLGFSYLQVPIPGGFIPLYLEVLIPSYPYLVIPVPEVPIFIFVVLCSADSPKPLHRWHRLVRHTQLCASECSGGAFFLNLMICCGCLAEFNALAMIDKAFRNTHCTDLHLVFCVRLLPSNREPLKWTGGGTARKSHRILHVLVY